jgi:hypothetical protein
MDMLLDVLADPVIREKLRDNVVRDGPAVEIVLRNTFLQENLPVDLLVDDVDAGLSINWEEVAHSLHTEVE